MKYENIIKECETQQDQKDFERRIDEWLSQFEEDERPLMIDLLMHYTYYSERSLKVESSRLFERFTSECKEEFIVVPIQREYGANFSDFFYTIFWMQNNIKSRAEKNIFGLARKSSLQHIEVIAIVDDYSGSAKSFIDFHRKLIETNEALKTKAFYFLTVASSSFSQLAINEYAKENGYRINLISLQIQDKAFENDYIYKRIESEIKRRQYAEICQKYSVRCIIEEEGFTVNEKKIRFQYSNQRQEVTGLIVNKKVSVSSAIIKEIDNAVYYCKKYGVESHMKRIGCDKSFYKEHLYGIAYFIKMIDVHKGEYYLSKLDQIVWAY